MRENKRPACFQGWAGKVPSVAATPGALPPARSHLCPYAHTLTVSSHIPVPHAQDHLPRFLSSFVPCALETVVLRVWGAHAVSSTPLCISRFDFREPRELGSWSLCALTAAPWAGFACDPVAGVSSAGPWGQLSRHRRHHFSPCSSSRNYCGRFSLRLVPREPRSRGVAVRLGRMKCGGSP